MLVQRNANKILGGILDEHGALFVVTELKQLLAEVVAKGIRHELNNVLVGLQPDHVNLLGVALLELLLEEAASMLVLAQTVDLTTKRLKSNICESVHSYNHCQ